MSASLKMTTSLHNPFHWYRSYIARLQELMHQDCIEPSWQGPVVAALNGQASIELQRVVPLEIRRKFGAYFTGTGLSKCLLSIYKPPRDRDKLTGTFYDPTCGMGDLLLAVAKDLPLGKTLSATLKQWGHQLAGTDLHAEFIQGAIIRLVLLARSLHQEPEALVGSPERFFPNIRVADGLAEKILFQKATTLLMNPPFGTVNAPANCNWAGGRVTAAAQFMINSLEQTRPGTEVLAILPEVLRSGSYSQRWRDRVSELAEVHTIVPYGVFDKSTDVNVFLLHLVRRDESTPSGKKRWPLPRATRKTTVGDYFEVHIGRVVPHRDLEIGPKYAYIHPRCVPMWTEMREVTEKRKHRGTPYQPPFVVLRRTSRPDDAYRAIATIIKTDQAVAVENHLIVCEPKDKTLKSCRALMRQLKTKKVNGFLNRRIQCRHLTVGAVEAVPFTLP